jgi:hypothetical protein
MTERTTPRASGRTARDREIQWLVRSLITTEKTRKKMSLPTIVRTLQ